MESSNKSPLGWAFEPLRRYADFSGRSRRTEYWWFFLLQLLVHAAFIAGVIVFAGWSGAAEAMADSRPLATASVVLLGIGWIIFIIGTIVPNAAVIVRRCQDIGVPGWVGGLLYASMFLISFTGLVVLVMMLIGGKAGANEYGLDPKGRDFGTIFS